MLPRKEHNYCHLCGLRYEEYLVHINSIHHTNNIENNKNNYLQIENTFQKVRNFWNVKNNNEIKIEKELIIKEASTQEENEGPVVNITNQSLYNISKVEIKCNEAEHENTEIKLDKENICIQENVNKNYDNFTSCRKRKYSEFIHTNCEAENEIQYMQDFQKFQNNLDIKLFKKTKISNFYQNKKNNLNNISISLQEIKENINKCAILNFSAELH